MPLVPVTRQLRFLPGEVIFREGDPATGLYVLSLGTVRIAAVAESGETILAHLSAPEVFGEMGVLDGEPRSGTATAAGFCVTYLVPAEEFLDVLERSCPVSLRLLAHLSRRLRRMNGRLVELPATATPFLAVTGGT